MISSKVTEIKEIVIHDDSIKRSYINHIPSDSNRANQLLLIIDLLDVGSSNQVSINEEELQEALDIMKEQRLLSLITGDK